MLLGANGDQRGNWPVSYPKRSTAGGTGRKGGAWTVLAWDGARMRRASLADQLGDPRPRPAPSWCPDVLRMCRTRHCVFPPWATNGERPASGRAAQASESVVLGGLTGCLPNLAGIRRFPSTDDRWRAARLRTGSPALRRRCGDGVPPTARRPPADGRPSRALPGKSGSRSGIAANDTEQRRLAALPVEELRRAGGGGLTAPNV